MSQPLSLKQNFFSLGKFPFQNILKDDYPHKKFETETYKATTKNNNTINYKTECLRKLKDGKTTFELKDELKFGYKLWKQNFLQTRVKRDGEIKYHIDFGNHMLKKRECNFFGAVKTDTNLAKFWVRAGMGIIGKNNFVQFRVEKKYQGDYEISSMGYYDYKPFYISFNSIKNLITDKTNRMDFSLNFNKNNFDLTFQHLSIPNTQTKFALGKLLLSFAYQLNSQYAFATWYKKNLQTQKQRCVCGIECKPNDKLQVKAKTDCKGKTSVSAKYKLLKNLGINIGAQLNVVEFVKQPEVSKIMGIPFGYSLDINI